MARMQTSGSSGSYAWAAVVFAIASVVLLIIAIILYTQVGKAQQSAQQAQQSLLIYATAGEQNKPEVMKYRNGAASVVGGLIKVNGQLKKIIGVDAQSGVKAINQKLSTAKVSGDLLQAVDQLQLQLASTKAQLKQAQDASKQALAAQQALQKQMAALSGQYKQKAAELAATVQQRVGQVQQLETQVGQLRQHSAAAVAMTRQELTKQIANLKSENTQATDKADALSTRMQQMVGGATVGGKTFAQSDGEIVSILPGQEEVSINRGTADHILLGMTFEVFPKGAPIRLNDANNLRGVATIQVIKVDRNASLARVVRQSVSQRGVAPGDQIVNLIYSPYRAFTFAVYGKFNIDNAGNATNSDRDRVESMIRRWGGKVTQNLSYNVDFLILGQPVTKPQPLPANTINAEAITQHTAAVKQYEQYQNLLAKAHQMSIPILNQNRFLTLVGYYQR